uniref:Uncharacterized protein n=1 Tax=Romanomermis culicivorax TaxID=13658 RepID=A0A915HKL4_ROMCU
MWEAQRNSTLMENKPQEVDKLFVTQNLTITKDQGHSLYINRKNKFFYCNQLNCHKDFTRMTPDSTASKCLSANRGISGSSDMDSFKFRDNLIGSSQHCHRGAKMSKSSMSDRPNLKFFSGTVCTNAAICPLQKSYEIHESLRAVEPLDMA